MAHPTNKIINAKLSKNNIEKKKGLLFLQLVNNPLMSILNLKLYLKL